jgi:hypothetical protein
MSPESVKSAAATSQKIASWVGDHKRECQEVRLGARAGESATLSHGLRPSARAPVTYDAEKPPIAIACVIKPTHIANIVTMINIDHHPYRRYIFFISSSLCSVLHLSPELRGCVSISTICTFKLQ